MKTTRRDVLLAATAIPIAAALAEVPLTREELRVLAMTATPKEAWSGREDAYANDPDRIVSPGTERHRIVRDLEVRGLIVRTDSPWRDDMEWYATATPAGVAVLRQAGVEA